MNAKTFSHALGQIDDKYITMAINYKPRRKNHSWVKWGAIAACFCLIVLGSIMISEYTKLTVREIDLTTSDIAEISQVYDGTLLVDHLEFTNANATSVKLSYLGTSSDYENSDWKALSISANYADYTMTMNCSFNEALTPADGFKKVDTITYGDMTVYLYRAAPTAEFEYIYTAIFEYDGVYYDLSTQSNDPDRIYELIATTTGASQVTDTTVSENPVDKTVSEIPEGAESFTGILGFDGYRVRVEESTPNFFIWHYYAERDGKQVCIAENSGYLVSGVEPKAYSIDLDGDTISELVCNVVYGTSAERVIVYRNNGGIIEQGTIDQSYHTNVFGAEAWHDGYGAIGEKYDPAEGAFVVTKTTSNGSIKTASFKDLDNFSFLPYDSHEVSN